MLKLTPTVLQSMADDLVALSHSLEAAALADNPVELNLCAGGVLVTATGRHPEFETTCEVFVPLEQLSKLGSAIDQADGIVGTAQMLQKRISRMWALFGDQPTELLKVPRG